MGYAYAALAAAAAVDLTPDGWDDDWTVPTTGDDGTGGPWPPGWPAGAVPPTGGGVSPSSYSLTVDAGASVSNVNNAPLSVTATTLLSGSNTDDLLNHVVKVTAAIGSTAIAISKTSGGTFTNAVYIQVSNYSGALYGISQTLYFNLGSASDGQTLTVTCTVVSTNPTIVGTDTASVSGKFILVDGVSGTNIQYTELIDAGSAVGYWCIRDSLNDLSTYKTSDSGFSWSLQGTVVGTFRPGDAHYSSAGSLIVSDTVAEKFYRSTDGGLNYTEINPGGNDTPVDLAGDATAIVCAGGAASPTEWGVLRSTDDGATWSHVVIGASSPFRARSVANLGGGVFVCVLVNGDFYRSTNSGASWVLATATADTVFRIYAFSSSIALAVADLQTYVYRTTDGGISWSTVATPEAITGFVHQGSTIYAFGRGVSQIIYSSEDSGATWQSFQTNLGWDVVGGANDAGLRTGNINGSALFVGLSGGSQVLYRKA